MSAKRERLFLGPNIIRRLKSEERAARRMRSVLSKKLTLRQKRKVSVVVESHLLAGALDNLVAKIELMEAGGRPPSKQIYSRLKLDLEGMSARVSEFYLLYMENEKLFSSRQAEWLRHNPKEQILILSTKLKHLQENGILKDDSLIRVVKGFKEIKKSAVPKSKS
ncbi:Uncharacterised protein [uncultured archaeon]|nr:Uncharacterised protein [uncultured archaeon]